MDLPKLNLSREIDNKMCFGCGQANPIGLKLKPHLDGDTATAEFVPTEYHQGWPGFVHGGILMAVLDESIGFITFLNNIYNVTARMELRLKSMARIGEPLIATARITKKTRRLLEIKADLKRRDGSVVAEASSIQFVV